MTAPSAAVERQASVVPRPLTRTLALELADPPAPLSPSEVTLYWLGQAGFVIDAGPLRLLIDPYLSDSLARKYRGARYTHVRMMASPIAPEQIGRVDLVLCTHRHTDHMDPDTLQPLAHAFPALRFVVPAASLAEAAQRCGVGQDRLIGVEARQVVEPLPGLLLRAVVSAHESPAPNADGLHEWLGYVIDVAGVRLYHSGDCVPYDGLEGIVRDLAPDIAMLPVNGRDSARSQGGVPGNFSLDEALALCHSAQVPAMVAHHYGLFDFNTVAPSTIDDRVDEQAARGLLLTRARLDTALSVTAR